MSASVLFPALVIFLHDLFTVLWIGGILFMALVMMPALRAARVGNPAGGPGPAGAGAAGGREGPLAILSRTVQSRLGVVSIVSLVGLVVTGLLLSRQNGSPGVFRFDTAYATVLSVKHLFVIALVGATLLRRRLSATGGRSANALLAVNVVLSVAILALSALNAAML
jgi:putative copper export protein